MLLLAEHQQVNHAYMKIIYMTKIHKISLFIWKIT